MIRAVAAEFMRNMVLNLRVMPVAPFAAIVLAVRQDEFCVMGTTTLGAMPAPGGVQHDLKQVLPIAASQPGSDSGVLAGSVKQKFLERIWQ